MQISERPTELRWILIEAKVFNHFQFSCIIYCQLSINFSYHERHQKRMMHLENWWKKPRLRDQFRFSLVWSIQNGNLNSVQITSSFTSITSTLCQRNIFQHFWLFLQAPIYSTPIFCHYFITFRLPFSPFAMNFRSWVYHLEFTCSVRMTN